MQKVVEKSKTRAIVLTIAAVFFVLLVLVPLTFALFSTTTFGNVALIPVDGVITADGSSYFGRSTVSSQDIVGFLEEANDNIQIKAIVLEINSPGGSPVAADEIATAIKKSNKPVIALIREVGASGGYWIASATSYIIANKMSITGSIGVTSSYLEFSGLMEKYGVGYERLIAGKYKDLGTPFKKLSAEETEILNKKLATLHTFFIQEIAHNRHLQESDVRNLATGEFYLGSEALQLGLVDELGDKHTAEEYLKQQYQLKDISYARYEPKVGFLGLLRGVLSDFSFDAGEGFGSIFLQQQKILT